VRFEKWQALGNDYVIVEEKQLPFELTRERIRGICARHTGVGSDGILLVRETEERGFVAEVVIYNPDGSEAELSGNGAREAILYLRRSGWVDHDIFSIETAAMRSTANAAGLTARTVKARIRREGWWHPYPNVTAMPGLVTDARAWSQAAVLQATGHTGRPDHDLAALTGWKFTDADRDFLDNVTDIPALCDRTEFLRWTFAYTVSTGQWVDRRMVLAAEVAVTARAPVSPLRMRVRSQKDGY
jgi:hypothetical protein